MNTNEHLHQLLLENWALKYKVKFNETVEFTYDGPTNWEIWESTNPKILFLLKEAWGGYHPIYIPEKITKPFEKNISRWRYAINELYKNIQIRPLFPNDDLISNPINSFSDIALVEIKKLDENKAESPDGVIKTFAKEDKDFLRKQIDLINPNIVVCCNTQEIGYDIIYDEIKYELISPKIERCACWKFENRLLIDFYHPSVRNSFRLTEVELYGVLIDIIQQGNVFEKFNWYSKNKI